MSERLKKSYEVAVDYFCAIDHLVLSKSAESIDRLQPFSYSGTVTVYYINGTHKLVENSDCTFSGYNMLVAGDYTVTVTYTERNKTISATYTLTVNKIWETIFNGWHPAYFGNLVTSDTGTYPYPPVNDGVPVDMDPIEDTGEQQFRITWQIGGDVDSGLYARALFPQGGGAPGLTYQPWCTWASLGDTIIKYLADYAQSPITKTQEWVNFSNTHKWVVGRLDQLTKDTYDSNDNNVDTITLDLSKQNTVSNRVAVIQYDFDVNWQYGSASSPSPYNAVGSQGISLVFNQETKKFEFKHLELRPGRWGYIRNATLPTENIKNSDWPSSAGFGWVETEDDDPDGKSYPGYLHPFKQDLWCAMAVAKIEIFR